MVNRRCEDVDVCFIEMLWMFQLRLIIKSEFKSNYKICLIHSTLPI